MTTLPASACFVSPRLRDRRVAILLNDGVTTPRGKTGLAFLRYSAVETVAVIDPDTAGRSLPDLTGIGRSVPIVASVAAALAHQPDTLLIGIAPSGGALPPALAEEVRRAIAAGLSVVNGLHQHLAADPSFTECMPPSRPDAPAQWIWDLRQEPPGLPIAGARAAQLTARRVLMVGMDMAVGKMSTGLELCRGALARGWRADFVATGQAGLAIAGKGVQLDAVRVDFAAGAIEQAVCAVAGDRDWLFVEGQGSLFHPGSTATLPLMRGAQPTDLILVHRAGQTHNRDHAHIPLPPLPDAVNLCELLAMGAGSFGRAPVRAIALNTHHLDDGAATAAIAATQDLTGLPCTDAVRYGVDPILDALAPLT
jgi:uncharacterized NAD-dependent epimerase/dehydratase family protein